LSKVYFGEPSFSWTDSRKNGWLNKNLKVVVVAAAAALCTPLKRLPVIVFFSVYIFYILISLLYFPWHLVFFIGVQFDMPA